VDFDGRRAVDVQLVKLIEQAQAGDKSAMRLLIIQSQDRLFRFALYLTGNRAHAQDLCQDTYIKLLKSLKDLRTPEQFWSWLFRILKNMFIDSKRQASAKGYVPLEDVTVETFITSKDAADELITLTTCLSRIDDDARTVIILVDIEGYSYAEAAEVVGVTENALRSRLHRARELLAEAAEAVKTSTKNPETNRRRHTS
jgi:RNA polymerase sigma-70 factor, ECF subfamily